MTRPDLDRLARRQTLTAALRGLRRKRNLSMAQAAERMGMSLRTYERFEGGDGRPDLERLMHFAQVVDADIVGLLCAVIFEDADLALRFSDNKLMWIGAHSLERFSQDLGEAAMSVQTFSAICAFDNALRSLAEDQKTKDKAAQGWISARRPRSP